MYWITLFLVVCFLSRALWSRAGILSPNVVFPIILSYLLFADYLVRGDEVETLRYAGGGITYVPIAGSNLVFHQALILLVYSISVLIPSVVFKFRRISDAQARYCSETREPVATICLAGLLLFPDLVKRLYFSGWDFESAIVNSLGRQGMNPWSSGSEVGLGNETFYFFMSSYLLPFAGVLFVSTVLQRVALLLRVIASLGLGLTLFCLFADGTRTYFAIPIVYGVIVYWLRSSGTYRRLVAVTIAGVVVAVAFSILSQYRSYGLVNALNDKSFSGIELAYHQDDNYYYIVQAADLAESQDYRMDPLEFLGVIVANPIPRYFWPNKPFLDQSYYQEYKPYWVTITYMGELIGMFGLLPGLFVSLIVSCVGFWAIRLGYNLLYRPQGLLQYLFVILFVYQCLRSLMNVSMFSYYLLVALGVGYGYEKILKGKNAVRKYLEVADGAAGGSPNISRSQST